MYGNLSILNKWRIKTGERILTEKQKNEIAKSILQDSEPKHRQMKDEIKQRRMEYNKQKKEQWNIKI